MNGIKHVLLKIKLMKSICSNIFSGYGNTVYCLLTIKEIQLSKQLLVKQIEQGEEVFIPVSLNQNTLSIFYRFYNPLIKIINDYLEVEKKNFLI